jgi:DoxX-like family
MTNTFSSKNTQIIYWSFTIIFALFMLLDGVSGVLHVPAGVEALQHLGYPEYMLNIVGTAKILGAIAILYNKFKILKEWAYAGFVFNTLGALASRYYVNDSGINLYFPVFLLAYIFISYYIWKKFENSKLITN